MKFLLSINLRITTSERERGHHCRLITAGKRLAPGSENMCQSCKKLQIIQINHLEPRLFLNTGPSTSYVQLNDGYVP
jgi:hypothetical protein